MKAWLADVRKVLAGLASSWQRCQIRCWFGPHYDWAGGVGVWLGPLWVSMMVSEVWRLTEEEGNGHVLLDVVYGLLTVVVAAEIVRVASSCIMLVLVAYVPGKCMRVVRDLPAPTSPLHVIHKSMPVEGQGVYGTVGAGLAAYGLLAG